MAKTNTLTSIVKVLIWLNKHFNFLMGSISGIATGTIVFFINYEHGFTPAVYSFLRQFFFNLLMGGFNIRTCEKLTRYFSSRNIAISMGTIVPSIQAFIILYSIHYFGHTPKPGASSIWQFGVNIIVFFVMAQFYRNPENKVKVKASFQKLLVRIKI